jgi:hypothetical protein
MKEGSSILSKGWGIMPNIVLFDDDLSSTAKLMLCYITSLAGAEGFCRPRNKHLSEKFHISTRQVSNVLQELGEYVYVGEDDKGRRIIALSPEYFPDEAIRGEGRKKVLGGTKKSSIHSNNNSIVKDNTSDLTDERKDEIKKIYKLWLIYMVVDPATRLNGTPDERSDALEAATKSYRFTPKRRDAIIRRLDDAGYEMLVRAIRNISKSDFHRGDNDQNWKADLADFLCRSYEKVEEWANKNEKEGN